LRFVEEILLLLLRDDGGKFVAVPATAGRTVTDKLLAVSGQPAMAR